MNFARILDYKGTKMKEKILEILSDIRPEFDFSGVDDFFDEGMLDSFDMITLVAGLDKAFDIHIDGLDIVAENFKNIGVIEKLLIKNGAK